MLWNSLSNESTRHHKSKQLSNMNCFLLMFTLVICALPLLRTVNGFSSKQNETDSFSHNPDETDRYLTKLNDMRRSIINGSYDPLMPPWKGPEEGPVIVNSSLYLHQIVSLNEKKQILTSSLFTMFQWYDVRLQWSPEKHQGVRYLRLPAGMVWKPDIVIENSAGSGVYISALDPHTLVLVRHDGRMLWALYQIAETFCSVDSTFFPFDTQTCPYILMPWSHASNVVLLKPVFQQEVGLDDMTLSTEWTLQEISAEENIMHASVEFTDFDDDDDEFWYCRYSVVIKRRMTFFHLVVLIPRVILTVLTMLMFVLPAHTGERMELGLAIWTSLVLLLLLVNDSLPSGHRLPVLGMILILMLLLVSLSLIMVIIGTLWHGKKIAQLPRWLQRIVGCCRKCSRNENDCDDSVAVSKCLDNWSSGLQIMIAMFFVGIIALYSFV